MSEASQELQDRRDGAREAARPIDADAGQETGAKEIWDEERLEKSLKLLKEMHIQLRGLRTTIPKMVAPLTMKQTSPESLFNAFSGSATTADAEVKAFKRLMNDKESRKILSHAKESRNENPGGIKPWRASDHPDVSITCAYSASMPGDNRPLKIML